MRRPPLLALFLAGLPARGRHFQANERGAILITVLLMVALMATLAVSLLNDSRMSIRRTAAGEQMMQARLYALGAEALGRRVVERSRAQNPDKTALNQPWADEPRQFPIPGGQLSASAQDGGGCFNLNALVETDERGRTRTNGTSVAEFTSLLRLLGLTSADAEGLASRTADYIDSDTRPGNQGAEDLEYALRTPPYRTAGSLLASNTEWRAVEGVTPAVFADVAPYLCTLPTTTFQPININTIPLERAVLLQLAIGADLDLRSAETIIAERVEAGFPSISAFFALPQLAGITKRPDASERVTLSSRYFTIVSTVYYGKSLVRLTTLIDATTPGNSQVVRREFGETV